MSEKMRKYYISQQNDQGGELPVITVFLVLGFMVGFMIGIYFREVATGIGMGISLGVITGAIVDTIRQKFRCR